MDRFQLSNSSRERIGFAAVAAVMLFLVFGLVKLQIFEHSEFVAQSESNRIRVVPVVPRRGLVFDREGRVVIDNRPSYSISVVPSEEVPQVTLPNLSELIDLDTLEIRNRIKKNFVSRYQPVSVKKDVSFEVIAILEEQAQRYPGVSYQMERVRQYPDSLGAEDFTGYVGEVSENDLEKGRGGDLRLGSIIGKKGLEKQYDYLLRGREGTAYQEISASGQMLGPYEGKRWVAAIPGVDLTLSIDVDIQQAAHDVMEGQTGAVVAMDPRTGEILAMTSIPTFDANIFSSVIPDSLWQAISNDERTPLLNRPISGRYPPGSTLKLATVGAGLEEGIISPSTTFQPCLGGMQFGNRFFHCWDPAGHGTTNAVTAIERSCDVYLYQLGRKLGVDLLSKYLGECGFGKLTGIDLPGEVTGLNPDSRYYNERFGRGKWSWALVLNNSIGQGEILATPIQITQFYCGLANNGIVYRPHLVIKQSRGGGDDVVMAPQISFHLPFSARTLETLKQGLRAVVEGEHGTARSLRNPYYSVGGKTGTAQNPHGENHSLFVGMAPMENPEIVVFAIVENAGHGSEVAAPAVGQVIRKYMEKTGRVTPIASTGEEGEK